MHRSGADGERRMTADSAANTGTVDKGPISAAKVRGDGVKPGLREAVFPQDQEPTRRRRRLTALAWTFAAVVVGAAVGLLRVHGGAGVFQTIWAEDGTYFYSDALGRPGVGTIVRPLHGYFVVFERMLATPARYVPVKWGPALLSIEAAAVTALLAVIVYQASRAHLRSTIGRLVAAVPVVAAPVGENVLTTNADNLATLQF